MTTSKIPPNCTKKNSTCFFCIMEERDPSVRKTQLSNCFKQLHTTDNKEHVLVLSGIWNIAMAQPNDPEFPSLCIFESMAKIIQKSIYNQTWLYKHQNIYIPYYAAHVIGSYTINNLEFAEIAIESGVVPPLMDLLRGKISWVEQRVAVRALGHLASYDNTFESLISYEDELVRLAMNIASTCLDVVYVGFVSVKDINNRVKYHSDLLTRGLGGLEMENAKAEKWASQLQCWSLYLLNCFACKERCLELICNNEFLEDLCEMWGGLVNETSSAGIGLIRILCYSKQGRKYVSNSKKVITKLCHLSRSSDDWQYMGIDCLLFLLKDQETKHKVIKTVVSYLTDLIELKSLGRRTNLGKEIIKALLFDGYYYKTQKGLQEISNFLSKKKREKKMSRGKLEERRVLVTSMKQEANRLFTSGEIERAAFCYSEAIEMCPLKLRKERMVLYSNRAQCYLLLRNPDVAIRDSTRALCLSSPVNSNCKSLWRRSQAYDMIGLAKESLMDCVMFIYTSSKSSSEKIKTKIPYYAARMISKQMDAAWLFANSRTKTIQQRRKMKELDIDYKRRNFLSGLSTIREEEPFTLKEGTSKRVQDIARTMRKKPTVAPSM